MINRAAQQQVEDETRQLVALVEEMTGLRSRWSGRVIWEDAFTQAQRGRRVLGEKRWNCDILLRTDLCDNPGRWRTVLHELLHSVSAGMNEPDFQRFRGWEEAWLMNSYLEALQVLQEACGLEEDRFYQELLQTPLALRPAAVRAWGNQPGFLPLFAHTIGKLR